MIARALIAAIVKDFRLLTRDRVGLVFLTIAPLIVMSVAGFSLSTLFGGNPAGDARYLLPIADEDGGAVADELRDRLAGDEAIEVRRVASRDEALALLRSRASGAALVVPAGTSAAIANGRQASLLLFTDPVKFVEVANVRFVVQELRQTLGQESIDRAQRRLDRIRGKAIAAQQKLERRMARLRAELERAGAAAGATRADVTRRLEAARTRLDRELRGLRERVAEVEAARTIEAGDRLERELEPLRRYLDALTAYRSGFESWLAAARAAAGSYADRLPPPPEPPALPPELESLARTSGRALAEQIVPSGDEPAIALPSLEIAVPPAPDLPALVAPTLRPPPELRLPRLIDVEETSVSGAPSELNSFDQYVPGFSITFLMLGMLLGVAMTLIDERELGTLDRIRAMQAPIATLVVGKLVVRFTVGVLQMIVLLLVGHVAFGVSLGPQPWALLLPTAGIVFVGTAFGVLVAGLAPTRDAVMPLGAIAIVTMCAVGGCWWPIDLEPRWMQQVARAFPTTWAMSGFKDLMMRRQTFETALQPTLALFAFGLFFLVAGIALIRPRTR